VPTFLGGKSPQWDHKHNHKHQNSRIHMKEFENKMQKKKKEIQERSEGLSCFYCRILIF
jgi:hypothetical protein